MKAIIAILAIILVLLLAAGVFVYRDGRAAKAEVVRLTAEVASRTQAVAEAEKARAACEGRAREDAQKFQAQIDGLKAKVADAETKFKAAEARMAEAAAAAARVARERKLAEDALAQGRKQADERLANERKLAEERARQSGIEKTALEQRLRRRPGRAPAHKPEEVKVAEREGRVEVTVASQILFESGSDRLRDDGMEILKQVADSVRNDPTKEIRVVGHTDNLPIREKYRGQFASNWELSSSRATAAVRYLQEACKIPGERLAAEGHGPMRPVAPNDDEAGCAKNRRIEILLVPAGVKR